MKTNVILSKISLVGLLVLCMGLLSCKKTEVGPAGPTGPQGLTGNANVKSSIFTINNWSSDSCCKSYTYKYHTGDLTGDVLDRGAISLYRGDNTGDNTNHWTAMPLCQQKLQYNFVIEMSTILITVTSNDGHMPAHPGVQKFKLVIIPPAS